MFIKIDKVLTLVESAELESKEDFCSFLYFLESKICYKIPYINFQWN
jgi:hypothetical protein